jgi:hypothetical protein
MAIHSNLLGSVTLTGDDAKAFTRMVTHGRANRAAIKAMKNGLKLVDQYAKKGVVTLKPRMTSRPPKK